MRPPAGRDAPPVGGVRIAAARRGCDLYARWKKGWLRRGGFGLNITSKETRLPLFPLPHLCGVGSFHLCLLCDARLAAAVPPSLKDFAVLPRAGGRREDGKISVDIRQVSARRC